MRRYVESFSSYTGKKLNSMIENYCKPGVSIKLAFNSSKISIYFSLKDKRLYMYVHVYIALLGLKVVYVCACIYRTAGIKGCICMCMYISHCWD